MIFQIYLVIFLCRDYSFNKCKNIHRCLRVICDNWNSFLGFPFRVEVGRESLHKRRKLQSDLKSASDEMPVSLQTDDYNKQNCKQPFYDARECLLQLKKSVASLHQKDLFPYNPEVLLRRYVHILIIFI